MTAQDMIEAARLVRVRELQTQLTKAAAENQRLAAENAELNAHLDLAILAAEDLRALPEGGRLVIVDGWNVILGARPHGEVKVKGGTKQVEGGRWKVEQRNDQPSIVQPPTFNLQPHSPKDLIAQAKRHLAEHPADFVWIVFDGPRENARVEGRLRISYTGGIGPHRADNFICDFLRMAKFRGDLGRIVVETRDKDFKKTIERLRQ